MKHETKHKKIFLTTCLGFVVLLGIFLLARSIPKQTKTDSLTNDLADRNSKKLLQTSQNESITTVQNQENFTNLDKKEDTAASLSSLLESEKISAKELSYPHLKEEIQNLEQDLAFEQASEVLNDETSRPEARRKLEEKIIRLSALKLVEIEIKTKEVQEKFAQLTKKK